MDSFSREATPKVIVVGKELVMLQALADFFPKEMHARAIEYGKFELQAEELVHSEDSPMVYVFVCSELPLLVNDFLAAHRPHLRISQVGVLVDDDLVEIWPSINLFGIQNMIRQSDIREGGKKEFQVQFNNWIR